MGLLQSAVKSTVGQELRATLRAKIVASEAFDGLHLTTGSLQTQVGNVSAVVTTSFNPSFQTGTGGISLGQAEAFDTIYGELRRQAVWKWNGSTAALFADTFIGSPSAYPVTTTEYIEYLQTAKRNLESRVSELETSLGEIQVYLPTMKKLIGEYSAASTRVENCIKDMTAKYGARTALEIARKKDVLETVPVDLFDEVE